jgi:lipid II:glycine glycyltransferase (peptidoglycan interpeptide bridge formation enzyme)
MTLFSGARGRAWTTLLGRQVGSGTNHHIGRQAGGLGSGEPAAALRPRGGSTREPEVRHIEDRQRWNDLIVLFPGHEMRQSFQWGRVRQEAGWKPFRYAVFDGDRCIACLGLLAWRVPGAQLSILYAPRAPLMNYEDEAAWRGVLAAIDDAARRTGAIFLRVSPPVPDSDARALASLAHHGFIRLPWNGSAWNTPRASMTLDVRGSDDELTKRMESNFRRRLRRSLREPLTLRTDGTDAGVHEFHEHYARFAARRSFPVRDENYFQRLQAEYGPGGSRVCFLERNGAPLAGDFTVRFGRRAHALYYFAEESHSDAKRLADWNLMLWARDAGCEFVDYGSPMTGIPPSTSEPGYGVYRYKKEMGCVLEVFSSYHDLILRPTAYHLWQLVEKRVVPWLWRLRAAVRL